MARRFGTGRVLSAAGLLALGIGLAATARATPQAKDKSAPSDPTKVIVPITTLDGVDLAGTYYKGNKGKDSPCAILLHKYGSDRSKGDWDQLARALQAKGFAVLTFDFRGHGDSKTVSPNFWKVGVNKDLVREQRDKNHIDLKDFKPAYLPWLVNDILAARKFLEVKNDSQELNIGSLFLIGAQEGASLGMLFAATEWGRTYTTGFKALQSMGTRHLGGEDIAGCVWLSLLTRPNNIPFEVNNWMRSPTGTQLRERTPTYLLYGERDTNAKQAAEQVFRALTPAREKDKNKFTAKYDVKGTDLAGQALLGQPSLLVTPKILEFTDKVLADRKAVPWASVAHEENPLQYVPNLKGYGFSRMP